MNLLKVVSNNFMLCCDEFTIDFVPKGNKTIDDKEFELQEIDDELYVYTTLGIIGKNASGKTTSVELLAVIYDILSNYRIKNTLGMFKYIDNGFNLDITFYHEGVVYRYFTDLVKGDESYESNLVLFKSEKLYKRVYKKTHSKNIYDYDKFEEVTNNITLPEDTSILYTIFNKIRLKGIYLSSDDSIYKDYKNTFNIYMALDNNLKLVCSVLKMLDEHISNITMISDNKFMIYYSNKFTREVTSNELYDILSSGTSKGLTLFTLVVYSLKTGNDLVIDEIENHFHKMLVENLINLYKDKSVNKNYATLIFTTHYCELLDLFGRSDNIYISKYEDKIYLENMYEKYKLRTELSKSNKFYENEFNTNVSYDALMEFKKGLI